MSKRARFLSPGELEEMALAIAEDRFSDFDSDDSIGDPEYLQESDDDQSERDMSDLIQEMVVEEAIEDVEEDNQGNISDAANWGEYRGRHQTFPFTGNEGLQTDLPADLTPMTALFLLLDVDVINLIVTETNRFADQNIPSKVVKKHARINKWTPTNAEEIKKFFGLTLWMGLVRLGSLPKYWSVKGIYRLDIPRSVMSRNRYQLLLSMLHFNNNQDVRTGDRLAKIQPLINILQEKYQQFLYPSEDIVIDETLVPWRGRLIFRQYIPNKAHRYGIKLFKLCSLDGYTWALQVYSGKSTTGQREVGLAKNVCFSLCSGLLDQGRTVYVDNFYTSYELAKEMLARKTHVVGTLRANKKNIPREVLHAKLKKGEMISREDPHGVVVLKWKDTRDVRLLSTKHEPKLVPIHAMNPRLTDVDDPRPSTSRAAAQKHSSTEETNEEQEREPSNQIPGTARGRKFRKTHEKPIAVLAYNKGKTGIDLSDQMASYATTLRKGVKWYKRLGLELLLGLTVVNAWILYKRATNKKIQIRIFRDMLVAEILQIKSDEALKPKTSTSSASRHKLGTRLDANGKKVRRKCAECYLTMQKELGRKEARNRSKMVYTFCQLCSGNPQLCLPCYNKLHG